ncbi:MAG: MBL fold metallo-hydrolase [Spirochaetia bacterium]|nr:MBL fold metallo-hydrolase [Spirochaetia bacterium]
MKITALGVNSAFSSGEYVKSVSLEAINHELKKIVHSKKKNEPIPIKDIIKNLSSAAETMYKPKWQSNFILEFEKENGNPYRLVLDFGSDFRHSLQGAGYKLNDIDGYYCSHPHADHIGGIEGVALSHIFNPYFKEGKLEWLKNETTNEIDLIAKRLSNGEQIPEKYKPDLFGHKSVLNELWSAARPGLETIQGVTDVNLHTYFNVKYMQDNRPIIFDDAERKWSIYTVTSVHVNAGYRQMPSYGLMLESSDGKIIYMPTDTQFMTPRQVSLYYEKAHVVYQDCETGPRSEVHPHLDDLKTLSPHLKKKLILYHYGAEPETEPDEFKEILKTGTTHEY